MFYFFTIKLNSEKVATGKINVYIFVVEGTDLNSTYLEGRNCLKVMV